MQLLPFGQGLNYPFHVPFGSTKALQVSNYRIKGLPLLPMGHHCQILHED